VGDVLWAVLGLPWFLTALIRSVPPGDPRHLGDLFALALSSLLALACLIALTVVWENWVMVSPEQAERTAAGSWTNRIGLMLSVAWPIQCGVGLVVSERL
jgi:hypothetical protein